MPSQLPWDLGKVKQGEGLEACDYCFAPLLPGETIFRRDIDTTCSRYCAKRLDVVNAQAEGR